MASDAKVARGEWSCQAELPIKGETDPENKPATTRVRYFTIERCELGEGHDGPHRFGRLFWGGSAAA